MQVEAAMLGSAEAESDAPGEESILGNLSPTSDDTPSMDTDEFDRKVKEFGYGEQPEVDSAQPKQEILSPEELVEQAGMDAIGHSAILNKPITPEEAADPEALEAKRQEMLATAQKIARTAAAMLDERKEAAQFVEGFQQRELEVDQQLVKVKELQQHWRDKVTELQQEVDQIRREAIPPRKITFATPTEQQPLATPKDNMKKAAEILKKKDEEIDIDYVRTLVTSAMKQQSPARIWLSDLEKNSIFCWFDLKNAFEKHFRGTYKRPATTSDLHACIQKKGETSRSFLTRWLQTRNECEIVDNRTSMHAFIGGLQRGGLLRHKLTCLVNANKLTLDDMITIASDHTTADDDAAEI
ncbi:hypothetical protein QYE76_047235 [Lolium multiflorum]|uniref:Retrotransposon gag domain-containing protein n=1 Tax=Lolium multiflorum TaxID=4521 RepID=A0AAD8WZ36_LOLMU|nr:hypothetical protein QYE76_047235 [Lolium multiflorum]